MNRVQVVGANGGGVAYSKARVIPWKKRIDEGFYKQKGGGFDMSPGGWFATMGRQKGGGWYGGVLKGDNKFFRKKQKGGRPRPPFGLPPGAPSSLMGYPILGYPPRKQKGGFSRVIARLERKRRQKGGGWFDGLSQGMFGIKQTRGKKKRKPAVISSAARSYPQKGGGWFDGLSQGMFGIKQTRGKKKRKPQKGGRYGFKGFFENPFHVKEKLGVGKKQKGGVLGLGKFEKWYGGKSKKEQGEIDAWTAKNL